LVYHTRPDRRPGVAPMPLLTNTIWSDPLISAINFFFLLHCIMRRKCLLKMGNSFVFNKEEVIIMYSWKVWLLPCQNVASIK
jgi:hypothetical protein